MIDTFKSPGRFWRGNIHGHSNLSDGKVSPEEACRGYEKAGYDFVCISDHFRDKYNYPITDTREFRNSNFTTIIGAELHAPITSRGVEWHILAVGLPFDFERPKENETGPELAKRAREAGAFVSIPHPHWYQLQIEDGIALAAAQAVEVYNHTSFVHTSRGDGAVFLDSMLSLGRRLNVIAVDDSHWKNGDVFGAWLMVKSETLTPTALLNALHQGNFYSSQGPQFNNITITDGFLEIECSPCNSISVVGTVSSNQHKHGQNITSAQLDLSKFKDSWCRVVISDFLGKCAWSNPLWL
jgi:hypothetical protein